MLKHVIIINGLTCTYNRSFPTTNKKPFVILHGWGCNKEQYNFMFEHYEKDFDIIVPDYPGFGESDSPLTPWAIEDYALWTKAFLDTLYIKDPIMMGHSNGGRIIIQLSRIYAFQKAILHSSAGLKAVYYHYDGIKLLTYKLLRLITTPLPKTRRANLLDSYALHLNISDYLKVSPILYKTMRQLDKYSLEDLLINMTCHTLLIFGDKDTSTPLKQGLQMESLLANSALVVFKGAGHFAFMAQQHKFLNVLDAFVYDCKDT